MKIAIHNTFFGQEFAEAELSRRLSLAAQNLGWRAIEVASSHEINQIQPDFVLNLHFRTPKLTRYPTYGCLWHPTALIETQEQFIEAVLSYDAFLSSSPTVDRWLQDKLYSIPKQHFVAPFFTSCTATDYRAPDLAELRLLYVGSNWDGERFKDLFMQLEKQRCLDAYGKPSGWSYLKQSYRGTIPFDGVSLLKQLNQAGTGLCLHREEHSREGIPSMRIFEIVASGAIAICGDHAFIRQEFADTVLYLEPNLTPTDQAAQIVEHLRWISEHQKTALEMSREAHQIFIEKFSLEKLLLGIKPFHERLSIEKGFLRSNSSVPPTTSSKQVQLVVRADNQNYSMLKKALDSVAAQTYSDVGILLVLCGTVEAANQLIEAYPNKLIIQTIQCQSGLLNSSYLWAGIQAVSAKFFGILDANTLLYPNHLQTLVSLLNRFEDHGTAISGVVYAPETTVDFPIYEATSKAIIDSASLSVFQLLKPSNLLASSDSLAHCGFLARRSLVDELMIKDPQIDTLEEAFLLLNLGIRAPMLFSYEATCEVSSLAVRDQATIAETTERIQTMLRYFPARQKLDMIGTEPTSTQLAQTELEHLQVKLAAMESSKFWKLRAAWFRLKRSLGWTTEPN